MFLSDAAIKRPVVAIVFSLLLVVFGAVSLSNMPVREAPDIDLPIVNVSTIYPGASAQIVETKITQIIEDQMAGIQGIKSIRSSSRDTISRITVEFELSRDIDAAANDVRDQVSRVVGRLPDDADPPAIQKADADAAPIIWATLFSAERTRIELSDFAERNLRDRLSNLPGVGIVFIGGERRPALRVWLDRRALAARGLTVSDVESALRRENLELGAGQLESEQRDFTLRTARTYQTPEDFRQLVIARGDNDYLIRLGEVAEVEVGATNDRSAFRANGENAVGLAIIKQSGASTLAVANAVRAEIDALQAIVPDDTTFSINADYSVFISASLREVMLAIGIAAALVIAVIYLFLGTIRAVLIPAVTVPVSLLAVYIVLSPLGYSINILTLLAMVLAIGLVVDDAIIVLENIFRRIKRGEPPLLAAYRGARQVGMAVVATTLVLIAVFVPITLMPGSVGRLFAEFAITMAVAVGCSMVVALTLTPVMCSKILNAQSDTSWLAQTTTSLFEKLAAFYRKSLQFGLAHAKVVVAGFLMLCASIVVLLGMIPQEFTPPEDRGALSIMVRAPDGASLEYTDRQMRTAIDMIIEDYMEGGTEEVGRILQILPMGAGNAGSDTSSGNIIVRLKDWSERDRSVHEITSEIFRKLQVIPGAQMFARPRPGFGQRRGAGGVQLVLGGATYEELLEWREIMFEALRANPNFLTVSSDFNETKPQMRVEIDRLRAADVGVTVSNISQTLAVMLGSRRATTYVDRGEEYDVILQGQEDDRRTPSDLNNIYVRSDTTGKLIPLSTVVTLSEISGATALNRTDRLRSITLFMNPAPGYALGDAVNFVEQAAEELLPSSARITWQGQAAELRESGVALYSAFGLALLVVFLVLAAQFESFRHPLVIMMTVPLATVGALGGLWLWGLSLNIYSQIGIIVLIGLATKNGILIVEFANQLRDTGMEFEEALVEASCIRLRPIIMTALATVMGAVPLMLASGAGAEGREAIGVVIFAGVSFASVVTLLVVPVFYKLMARNTSSPGAVAKELADYERAFVGRGKSQPEESAQPAE